MSPDLELKRFLSTPTRRVVLMGQGGVGKTAMVLRYTTGDFSEQVRPLRAALRHSLCRSGWAMPLLLTLPARPLPTNPAVHAHDR